MMAKYTDKVLFVFRNKLIPGHANARAAASFAEAAGLQGKYWEMHDKLYASQSSWESLSSADRTTYFLGIAKDLGLDTTKVNTDVASDAIAKKIDFDEALATKRDVTGTPSIYINGTIVDEHYKDNAITTTSTDSYVWSDATAFENLILIPALKNAGVQ
jgi:protein-disulfide isomerase